VNDALAVRIVERAGDLRRDAHGVGNPLPAQLGRYYGGG
jgi:hypothetical protein